MLNEKPSDNRNHLQQPSPQEPKPEDRSGKGTPEQGYPEDYVRMKEWIRQAQTDAERASVQSEQTREHVKELREELGEHDRRTRRSGWSSALLWLALIGAGVYGYVTLQGQGTALSQMPVLQESFHVVSQRLSAAESQIRDWTGNWDAVAARLGKVENTVASSLRAAKEFTTEQTAKVQHQMQDEMSNRTRAMETRLAQTETAQQKDRAQLATLQQQVGTLHSESAQQLARAQQENGREFGDLRREIGRNRDDFDTLARQQETWRADFELSKEQRVEVAPGLAVTVAKTDVARQQVSGWLHLVSDGKILWLHDQGIHQPVLFRNQRDNQSYELVFTRVGKDGAVGYVLLPRYPSSEAMQAAESAPLPEHAAAQ